MNCDDLSRTVSQDLPLSKEMESHLRTCAGCRATLDALQQLEEIPDARQLELVKQAIAASLRPVRPLPSDGAMIVFAMILFVVFAVLATVPFGYAGFGHLTTDQKVWYYSVILVAAVLFSLVIVQQIVPGSPRRVPAPLVTIASLIALVTVSAALFANYDLGSFVHSGFPCLRLGVACAAASGALATLFLRKGFSPSPVQTSCTMGFFGGLSGIAVLALHCPIQNTAHIIVWHLGAMIVSGLGGAAVGYWREHVRTPRSAETLPS